MGYSFTIGEAVMIAPNIEDVRRGRESPQINVVVLTVAHDAAPTVPGDDADGNTNHRSPSARTWEEFCRVTGLDDLFYNEANGLLRKEPGCSLLVEAHHAVIADALDQYRARTPEARPGYREPIEGGSPFRGPWTPETEANDGCLARLVWLEWWVRWALANCKVPALYSATSR